MAVSKIKSIHTTPEKTLKYVSNPDKTQEGALVFCNCCSSDPSLANIQMKAHRNRFGKDSGVLLHHGFVSFAKNEITIEQAYEFAQEFVRGMFSNYQYFGSVHANSDKVHFHFVINSVGFDGKKYWGNKDTLNAVRSELDRYCVARNLSVIIPKGKGITYKEHMEAKKNNSWKMQIRNDIDATIDKVKNFDEFLMVMRSEGYYVKHGDNVMHILFKKRGMEKGARGRGLGAEYTEQAIKDRIQFKEFNFMPLRAELKKPKMKMKPLERELMKLYYRRPTIATNFAMGIHLLNSYLTGAKYKINRYEVPEKKAIRNAYYMEVKKLELQVKFCHANNIKSRKDIENHISNVKNKMAVAPAAELTLLLNELLELRESLNQIRDRSLFRIVNNSEGNDQQWQPEENKEETQDTKQQMASKKVFKSRER